MNLLVVASIVLGLLAFGPGDKETNAFCEQGRKPAWFHPSRYNKKVNTQEVFLLRKECEVLHRPL